jgi:hypothetical protein
MESDPAPSRPLGLSATRASTSPTNPSSCTTRSRALEKYLAKSPCRKPRRADQRRADRSRGRRRPVINRQAKKGLGVSRSLILHIPGAAVSIPSHLPTWSVEARNQNRARTLHATACPVLGARDAVLASPGRRIFPDNSGHRGSRSTLVSKGQSGGEAGAAGRVGARPPETCLFGLISRLYRERAESTQPPAVSFSASPTLLEARPLGGETVARPCCRTAPRGEPPSCVAPFPQRLSCAREDAFSRACTIWANRARPSPASTVPTPDFAVENFGAEHYLARSAGSICGLMQSRDASQIDFRARGILQDNLTRSRQRTRRFNR